VGGGGTWGGEGGGGAGSGGAEGQTPVYCRWRGEAGGGEWERVLVGRGGTKGFRHYGLGDVGAGRPPRPAPALPSLSLHGCSKGAASSLSAPALRRHRSGTPRLGGSAVGWTSSSGVVSGRKAGLTLVGKSNTDYCKSRGHLDSTERQQGCSAGLARSPILPSTRLVHGRSRSGWSSRLSRRLLVGCSGADT